MASGAHLPRSGEGDPSDHVNMEIATLRNIEISDTAVPLNSGARRTTIFLQNQEGPDVFIGFDNTVTTTGATRGVLLTAGDRVTFDMAETIEVWAIIGTGTMNLTVVEAF